MRRLKSEQKGLQQDSVKTGGLFKQMMSTAGGFAIGGAITAISSGIGGAIGGLINANAKFEMLNKQLNFVTGSAEEAKKVYEMINKLAIKSPYSETDLGEGAVLLEAYGVDSTKWMETIGDASSVLGKTIMQTTNAVTDAVNGQYRRLIEYGIQATEAGGQTIFEYVNKQGERVTKSVESTNKDLIESTLFGIMNDQYGGAMAEFSDTWIGQIATLKDNIKAKLRDATSGIFGSLRSVVAFANNIFAVGWKKAFTDAFGGGVVSIIERFMHTVGFAFETVGKFASGMIEAFRTGKRVRDLVADLPAPLRGIATAIFTIADGIGDIFRNLIAGDWRGALSELWDTLKNIGSIALDLGTIIVDGALELGQFLLEKAKDFGGWLWGKIKGAWNGALDAGTVTVDGKAVENRGWLLKIADAFKVGWFVTKLIYDVLGPVAIAKTMAGILFSAGQALGAGMRAIFNAAFLLLLAMPTDMYAAIVKRVIQGAIVLALIPAVIVAAVYSAIALIVSGIIYGFVFEGGKASWGGFAAQIGKGITGSVNLALKGAELAGAIAGGIADLITGLIRSLDSRFPGVRAWFRAMPGKIKEAIGNTFPTLDIPGQNLITGFWTSMSTRFVDVVAWLKEVPSNVATAIWTGIGTYGGNIRSAGVGILQKMWDGITGLWSGGAGGEASVYSWFVGVASKAAGAIWAGISSYGGSLSDAGGGLMSSVRTGLENAWASIVAWLQTLNPWDYVKGKAPSRNPLDWLSVGSGDGPGLPSFGGGPGMSSAGGGGVTHYYDLRGAIIGPDAERWLQSRINQGTKAALSQVRSNQLSGVKH